MGLINTQYAAPEGSSGNYGGGLKNVVFAAIAIFLLLLLAQWNGKVGLATAGILFLSVVVLNIGNFNKLMNGEVLK